MTERRKSHYLTLHKKSLILEKIKNGESRDTILNTYNISKSTLRRIVQYADKITDQSKNFELRNKKTTKSAEHTELEAALLKWFHQRRASNQPISATMIQEKALILNELLKGPAKFKASNGWFFGFKHRHELRRISLKGEILSNDTDPLKNFSEFLMEKIRRENLKLENIYNADESGIYWKTLLDYTFAFSKGNSVAGFKDSKDRFTALFCANASGSHRIPLLIIGKSPKPRDLKNFIPGKANLHNMNYLAKLDVSYSAQKSGWMNCEIFKKWYEHEFIPRVLQNQQETRMGGKVLLILDNAPSHPSKEELNAINKNFEVMFLPPDVTALIQPMDQSPISITKKLYKRNLMRKLLIEKDYEKIETFLKDLTLKDCLVMLSNGWSSVKKTTLKNAWKALLLENMRTQKDENFMYHEESSCCETNASVEEFCAHLTKCLSKEDEEKEEMSKKVKSQVEEWFNADEGDNGFEILSDEQIVESVLNRQFYFVDIKSPSMVSDQAENIHEELKSRIDEDEDENIHEKLKSRIEEGEDENIHEEQKHENIDIKSPSMVIDQAENIHEKLKSRIDEDEDENIHEEQKYENIDIKSPSMVIDQAENIYEELRSRIDEDENIHEEQKYENIDIKSPSMVIDQAENSHEELKSRIDKDENENIAAKEALEGFLKFKSWMMTHVQCSEFQILHYHDCENILRNATNNSQNM